LPLARRRRNLTVLTGAHAQRILLDGERATGVEYRDAARVTQHVTASHEVILSGGTVNSPQLLMLSGIGDADQLRAVGVQPRHDLVGVGANLQDHLACGVIVHCPKPITLLAAESPAQLARFLLARRAMLTSNVAEAVAFVRSDPTLAAPDFELIWLPGLSARRGRRACRFRPCRRSRLQDWTGHNPPQFLRAGRSHRSGSSAHITVRTVAASGPRTVGDPLSSKAGCNCCSHFA